MPDERQERLLEAARAGDRAAFEALLEPQIETCYRLACGILLDPHEAQDAVQEAALKAWRQISRHRRGSDFKPWFTTIVANQCRSIRRSRWWRVVKGIEEGGRTESVTDTVPRDLDLDRALRRLAPDDRAILVLHYYLDLSLAQIATVLKISPAAAKSRLYRAIHRLRPYVQVVEVNPG